MLSRVEFDEVVARRGETKLNLHPDLLDRIFNWTTGHVGAIVQLLDIISSQVSLSDRTHASSSLSNYPFRWLEKCRQELRSHSTPFMLKIHEFGRSLPQDEDLADPSVASFFRTLIGDGEVEEGVENHEVLDKCHRKGWIRAYITGSDYPDFRYSFASPLHSSAVSWALPPSKEFLQSFGAS